MYIYNYFYIYIHILFEHICQYILTVMLTVYAERCKLLIGFLLFGSTCVYGHTAGNPSRFLCNDLLIDQIYALNN